MVTCSLSNHKGHKDSASSIAFQLKPMVGYSNLRTIELSSLCVLDPRPLSPLVRTLQCTGGCNCASHQALTERPWLLNRTIQSLSHFFDGILAAGSYALSYET